MAPVASKANPLLSSIPWRRIKLRSIYGGRVAHAPTSSSAESSTADSESVITAGKKILETFSEEFEIGSRKISLETGKIARFANGAVVLGMEETKVLSTVTSAKSDGTRDFLPLTVGHFYRSMRSLLYISFVGVICSFEIYFYGSAAVRFRFYQHSENSMQKESL